MDEATGSFRKDHEVLRLACAFLPPREGGRKEIAMVLRGEGRYCLAGIKLGTFRTIMLCLRGRGFRSGQKSYFTSSDTALVFW